MDKEADRIKAKRRARELNMYLRDLTEAVNTFIGLIDEEMAKPSSVQRGARIAQLTNALQIQNDLARRFGLGERP